MPECGKPAAWYFKIRNRNERRGRHGRRPRYIRKVGTMFEIPDTIKKSKAFKSLRTEEAAREVLRVLIQKNTFPEFWLQKGISLTYAEAEILGISKDRFTSAIDQLIEVGLIDISETKRQITNRFPVTLYILSNRWRYYGSNRFKHRERPKRKPAPMPKPKPVSVSRQDWW